MLALEAARTEPSKAVETKRMLVVNEGKKKRNKGCQGPNFRFVSFSLDAV